MRNLSWVVSTKRMIVGLIAAVVISVLGFGVELLFGVDIGLFNSLMPAVGVVVFCLIALRKPKEQ